MRNYVKLVAPAKVNLVLAVGDITKDGFHKVNTVMHALALHDVLEMYHYEAEEDGTGLVVRINSELDEGVNLSIPTEENIIYRAIASLASEIGRAEDEEIRVTLTKHIPSEAGLGGGSSNAAAALRGAALMWGISLDDERLLKVAKKLGADVSFFLHGGCAYLNGKGDELVKTLIPRKDFCVIVRPDEGISTKEAYQAFDKNPVQIPEGYLDMLGALEDSNSIELWNNMTSASRSLSSQLEKLFAWIETLDQKDRAILCGSGSAVCIICSNYDEAVELSVTAQRQGFWTRVSSLARIGAQEIESY